MAVRRHLKRWGACWLLALLFLGSWVGQFVTQLAEARATAQTHQQPFTWSDFWPEFAAATFENWQSEFFQLLIQALLIASIFGRYVFAADDGADKQDVEKILDAIKNGSQR